MDLTKRQKVERETYDKMGKEELKHITEGKKDLFIDPVRIPFPYHAHEHILTRAFSKMGCLKSKKVLEWGGELAS